MNEEDLALETLIGIRGDVAAELDEEVLRQCYQIQKRFQFSSDRAAVVTEMERLIDASVARSIENQER